MIRAGYAATRAARRADGGFTLVEIIIALAILSWVCVSLLGTVTLVQAGNRYNYRWAIAHLAAQHQISYLEASPAVNNAGQLLLQDGMEFTISDAAYIPLEGETSTPQLVSSTGRVYVYDLAAMPVAQGGWDHAELVNALMIRVSIDIDDDGDFQKPLADVDPDDVNVYSVRVF
jgi:prepilin-type N-terminal cleavage/methylation domain-containing protein